MQPRAIKLASLMLVVAAQLAIADSAAVVPAPLPESSELSSIGAHSFRISTLAVKDGDAYRDLEAIGRSIGNARVVFLGEPNHASGTSVEVRARIARYLHAKLGFGVLAYEASFFNCDWAWRQVENQASAGEIVPRALLPMWWKTRQGSGLLRYVDEVASSSRPLIVAGLDPQFSVGGGEYARLHFEEEFLGPLRETGCLPRNESGETFLEDLRALVSGEAISDTDREVRSARLARQLTSVISCSEGHGPSLSAFWRQLAKNVVALAKFQWSDPDVPENANRRDEMMADNLRWLTEVRYPGQKVIVWSANLHAARNLSQVSVTGGQIQYDREVPLGEHARNFYGERAYSMLVTAYEGATGGRNLSVPVAPATEGSLEAFLAGEEMQAAFVDLRAWRAAGNVKPFRARPFGYLEMAASWPEIADASLFVRKMEPGEFPEPAPKDQ